MTSNVPENVPIDKQPDELMNRVEAAKYLGVKPATLAVWDCVKRYNLQPIKIGKKLVRYRRSVLDDFLRERMTP